MNCRKRKKSDLIRRAKFAIQQLNAVTVILFLLVVSQEVSCAEMQKEDSTYKDQSAIVKVFICSRGCYQYLVQIEMKDELKCFYPDSLPKKFRQDNLEVIITGTISSEKKQVFKPSPTDAPIPDFLTSIIILESIELSK